MKTTYKNIYKLAAKNRGGFEQLEASLPRPRSSQQLAAQGDDRYLSMMTRCVFRAGFVWRVIDNKWPGFEEAFCKFNPLAIAHFSDEKLEELGQDTRIVRNFTKIVSVRHNAMYVLDKQHSHGSFGKFIADWPENDIVGLWLELKKNGSRMGGNSGPGMLRSMGKDTFLLTQDVSDALVRQGLMKKFSPTAQRDLRLVEQVFADLREQSGRSLCELSRMLAFTV
ncbi:3-methyl-adenine DNA glycosylase I [Gammaproteobacteria bacterium MOLA455]|nr:3-methyl-adenine DNA glycosylase I [Gammaproteobacteria bacterium MOLA455]